MSGAVIGTSPGSINFGSVLVGQTGTRVLQIFNLGDQDLTLTNVMVSSPRFSTSFTDQRIIGPGGVYALTVAYLPNGLSHDVGMLSFSSNATNGSFTVPLEGMGAAVPGPDIGAGRLLFAPTGESAGDQFGISVDSAGDINGDGFGDVIVGAWTSDANGGDAGRAYIYLGGATPNAAPWLVLTGEVAGDNFGTSVASVGDVNGDGHPDVAVGAWGSNAAGLDAGRAYVFFGGPTMDALADRTFTGQAANDRFGVSVSAAGDVNGDGFADVVVGAFGNDAGGTNAGRAYVYFGGPFADNVADWTLTGEAPFDHFGWVAAGAGDVNADGFADVIVGAYQNDAGGTDAGRAYLYFGGLNPNTVPDQLFTGGPDGERFGVGVSKAGDVNGDGYADLIVGADSNPSNGSHSGRAYVFYGGPLLDAVADKTLSGDRPDGYFGSTVATARDVNGDGFDDLLVGAWETGTTVADAGNVYLFLGGPSMSGVPAQVYSGEGGGDHFGNRATSAGDFDGDGHLDIITGAYFNDAYDSDAGRAYVVSPSLIVAPVVTAPPSVAGSVGSPISFAVTASVSGEGAISSLTATNLPAGAQFVTSAPYTTGTFTWTPGTQQTGSFAVTFTASNGAQGFATTSIVVTGGNGAPIVTAPASVFAAEGTAISFAVQATDPDGDHVVLGVVNRPVGSLFVDLGNNSGNFSWTPGFGQAGSYTVSFTARDDRGAAANPANVALLVDNVNRPPTAAAGGPYSGVVNVPVLFNGTASSDPDGDILAYEWSFGDLATGSGPNPLHSYHAGGVYTAVLTVRDSDMAAVASTIATIQEVFPARAFLAGGNKVTRLNSGKAQTCVQIEPVNASYLNTSVTIASIAMISVGTGSVDRIEAVSDKSTIGADLDKNGVDEIAACFAKDDLRNLFSGLSGGRHTVGVALEGTLTSGGRFRGTLEMDVVASGNALAASVSPNPLNPSGSLSFRTTKVGAVTVTMFDHAGRFVRTLFRESLVPAGYHDASIDGRREDGAKLPSGVYFYRVETAEGIAVGRIVILK